MGGSYVAVSVTIAVSDSVLLTERDAEYQQMSFRNITGCESLLSIKNPSPRRAGIGQWYSAGLRAGWSGIESRLGIFLFTTASRPTLGSAQPPIQWVIGPLSLGVKRSGREAITHSPVTKSGAIPPLPQYTFMASCSIKKKHRDNFIFTHYHEWLYNIEFYVNSLFRSVPQSHQRNAMIVPWNRPRPSSKFIQIQYSWADFRFIRRHVDLHGVLK
jgi:hypothetical protein